MGATISPESAPKPSTVGSLDKSITPIRSEIPPYSLFARSGLSRANPLNLIRGFENEPLVSLEEALAPLFGKTDYLRNYIKEAKVYSHHPSEHGLTSDESAAIYIYTMKWGNACLYNRLQMAWESGDPLKMKVWLRYLKLFKTAYNKLPEVDEEIWQGKSFDPRLKNDLESETAPLYLTMELLSSSKTFVEQSLSNGGVQGKILIGFERVGAKWAGDYAADSRNGAIVFPGPQVTVSKIEPSDDGNSVTYHVIGPARKYQHDLFSHLLFYCRIILFKQLRIR